MATKWVKLFLRAALSAGFLSAVADRLGFWPQGVSAWGSWTPFLEYTQSLIPWLPASLVPLVGFLATFLEAVFGICLLVGFYTEKIAYFIN